MNIILLFFFASCLIDHIRPQNLPDLSTEEWDSFKREYSKKYESSTEETLRMQTYITNKRLINLHNEKFHKGEVSYKLSMNQFGDMLLSEYVKKTQRNQYITNEKPGEKNQTTTFLADTKHDDGLPKSIDWRDKGAVTKPKSEGVSCSASWAFSVVGALEAQYFIKNKELVSLSEQNLIDCAKTSTSDPCHLLNLVDDGFDYVISKKGINTQDDYPYEDRQAKCKYNAKDAIPLNLTDYKLLDYGDEELLKRVVALKGPVSIAIDAAHDSFRFYTKGVWHDKHCSPYGNQWALVVGYGEEKGQEYWLVKNSWGRKWGDDGYIKVLRNKNNVCGIASQGTFPILD